MKQNQTSTWDQQEFPRDLLFCLPAPERFHPGDGGEQVSGEDGDGEEKLLIQALTVFPVQPGHRRSRSSAGRSCCCSGSC